MATQGHKNFQLNQHTRARTGQLLFTYFRLARRSRCACALARRVVSLAKRSVESTHATDPSHVPTNVPALCTTVRINTLFSFHWSWTCVFLRCEKTKVVGQFRLFFTILKPQTAETSSITLTLLVHRRRIPIPHPILAPELHRLRIDKRHVPRERRDGPRRAQLARPFGVALHALNENELRNETHTRRGERERPAPDNGGGSHAGQGRAPGHGSKRLRKLTRLRSDESVP